MKLNSNYCKLLALAAGISLAVPASAPAAIVLTLQEVGTDVVLSTPGGSINQSLVTVLGSGRSAESGILQSYRPPSPFVDLAVGSVLAVSSPSSSYMMYEFTSISGPDSISTQQVSLNANTSSGNYFGFHLYPTLAELYLPFGSNLGALGQGESTFVNTNPEVVPESWIGRIVNPESETRSPCPRNDVSTVPI